MRNTKKIIYLIIIVISIICMIFLITRLMKSYKSYHEEKTVSPTPLIYLDYVNLKQNEHKTESSNNTDANNYTEVQNNSTNNNNIQILNTPGPVADILKTGSKGEKVKEIQERLKELGYYKGEIDSNYGPSTKQAVFDFQKDNFLETDGRIGPNTKKVLFDSNTKKKTVEKDPIKQVDTDFLILVNYNHELDEDYIPSNLEDISQILDKKIKIKYKNTKAEKTATEALNKMLLAAIDDGIKTWQVSSAYRSISEQKKLFDKKYNEYIANGMEKSKAYSATKNTVAVPRQSEHHTGLAFDITVPGTIFKGTPQARWIEENCWDYGFILRYQENKKSITRIHPEPWHIRYVGLPHSKIIKEKDLALEEYLEQK